MDRDARVTVALGGNDCPFPKSPSDCTATPPCSQKLDRFKAKKKAPSALQVGPLTPVKP